MRPAIASSLGSLALAILLAGCTDPADPSRATDGTPPAGQPTGSNSVGTVDGDPGYVYPDPLSDNEVVNGRRVEEGAFPAIWPETSLAEVALVQLATLEGHQTWRLTPEETAERFAVQILRWSPADVRSSVRAPKHPWWPMSKVRVRSTDTSDGGALTLSMRAFGPWGSGYRWREAEPGTVWSVERVDTKLLALDALFDETDPTTLLLAGAVRAPDPSEVDVSIDLFDGSFGRSGRTLPTTGTNLDGAVFQTHGAVRSESGDHPVVLSVTLTDRPSGELLGLDVLPIGSPRSTPGIRIDDDRRIWPLASHWYVGRQTAKASPYRSSRTSSTDTAERFAVEVLGWDADDVASFTVDGWDSTVVAVWNERMEQGRHQPALTLVTVAYEEICTTSDEPYPTHCHGSTVTGYWTVASADSALVALEPARVRFGGDLLRVPVSIVGGLGSRHVELELSDGAAGTGPAGWIRLEWSRANQGRILGAWSVEGHGWVTVLASIVDDDTGIRLAVDAVPILIPRGGAAG
jgi:hypothetical protein